MELGKRDIIVTLTINGGGSITETISFDPHDIYDAALASKIRGLARELLGEPLS